MKNYLWIVFFLCLAFGAKAQEGTVQTIQKVTTVQPKIMVVPYTKEGEDIRTLLEEDVNKRTKVSHPI